MITSLQLKRDIGRLIKYKETTIGSILMMHRVGYINKDKLWYNEHIKLSPETIENFVKKAVYNGCSFISLDELHYIVSKKKRARRVICITLDDGYDDNYSFGYPCFKALNIPFCIYVSSGFLNKEAFLWWNTIEDLILNNEIITLSNNISYNCSDVIKKESVFLILRSIILNLPQRNIIEEFENIFSNYQYDPFKPIRETGLSWDHLCALIKDPLVTIGNHTYSHMSFNGCSDNEIINDIILNQKTVQQKTGYEMKHFSFPYGEQPSITSHHIEIVKNLNYNTVTTAYNDSIRYSSSMYDLPRKFITEKNADLVLSQIIKD